MRLALGLILKQPTPLKTKNPTKMEIEGQGADSPEQKSPFFNFFAAAAFFNETVPEGDIVELYIFFLFGRFLRGKGRSEALDILDVKG